MLTIVRRNLWLVIILALMVAATIYPVQIMLFGMAAWTGNVPAPGPLGPALLVVLGWVFGVMICRIFTSATAMWTVHGIVGLIMSFIWLSFEPHYQASHVVFGDPSKALTTNSFLFAIVIWGFLFWAYGAWLASDYSQLEGMMLRVQVLRIVLALGAVSLLVLLENGANAATSRSAVMPVAIVVALLSVSMFIIAQSRNTRRDAARLGAPTPSWHKMLRAIGTWAAVGGLGVVLVYVVMGREGLHRVGMTVVRIMQAILWAFTWAIGYVGTRIMGRTLSTVPITAAVSAGPQPAQGEISSSERSFPYLVWVVIAVVTLLVFLFLRRLRNHRSPDHLAGETSNVKSSVFSFGLLRDQLRKLFRHGQGDAIRTLSLRHEPATVREAMLQLQALARRQNDARAKHETAADFGKRLTMTWPGLDTALDSLTCVYEETRYGETPEQLASARASLSSIKAARLPAKS